ncbi:GFA family protein [Paludibacterium sp. B53371]|uniref:GFA family protein n=1 Tax=Paludibacterium sp. B53371 TaxID=2806263 RepID=UPI00207B7728|nr:GFA family protein [Paludibacterium sp. B53371]
MQDQLTGGCLCGSIRYVVRGVPGYLTHCHCKTCRKASGAAFVSWFTVRVSEVEWRGEAQALYRSSAAVERGFCRRCGTTLSYRHESDPGEVDLTLCSLDQPQWLQPEHHTWWASHLPWAEPAQLGGLPVHERSVEEGSQPHPRRRSHQLESG